MRAAPLFILLSLAASPLLAQNTTPSPATGQAQERPQQAAEPADPQQQRVQRIRVEDGGSRVDELRVGGQTQSITVQPKVGDMPAYEVQPNEGARGRLRNDSSETNGARVWNFLKF